LEDAMTMDGRPKRVEHTCSC